MWATKSKNLGITKVVPHLNNAPAVVGGALSVSKITFSPLELYGAAARCSTLSGVDPNFAGPERQMMQSLLEHYIDDVNVDFAILGTADKFKDYVKSYFAGTVAAGIAYIAMIRAGYDWFDHFENVSGGNPNSKKSPDFVFTSRTLGIAIMESKGSRSGKLSTFDGTTHKGYVNQVEPHLGHALGGQVATHGYCIGSYLRSTAQAEMRIHHTAVAATPSRPRRPLSPASPSVLRGNYANAFGLVHTQQLARQLRSGDGPEAIQFSRFHWRGRSWLSTPRLGRSVQVRFIVPGNEPEQWLDLGEPNIVFAIEEKIAETVLAHFLGTYPSEERALDLEPLREEAAATSDDGVVFPDGMAVLRGKSSFPWDPVVWHRGKGVVPLDAPRRGSARE